MPAGTLHLGPANKIPEADLEHILLTPSFWGAYQGGLSEMAQLPPLWDMPL